MSSVFQHPIVVNGVKLNMASNFKQYDMVWFTNCKGVNIPLQPWPQTFYICRELFTTIQVELRPLTVMGLLKGVGKNFITMNFWRLLFLLRTVGFLAAPEGSRFSIKQWQWKFWKGQPCSTT